eukprot:CAMPEP_0117748280 /NCGR_PEP_ID=MMETSP0947-20121206/8996_1 /TAXON_ID=44440 /ORGANISM="Chattonella subsalsa, Strain CCMP2191" /LENGTH=140 /DNA_ID=CAMNT_0005565861 /DNA_START=195 /DNA_END=617 /DNA_ORIENTATION=-
MKRRVGNPAVLPLVGVYFFGLGSVIFYFIFCLIYSSTTSDFFEPTNFYGVAHVAFGSDIQWLYLWLIPITAISIEVVVIYVKNNWMRPDSLQILSEMDSLPIVKLAKWHNTPNNMKAQGVAGPNEFRHPNVPAVVGDSRE